MFQSILTAILLFLFQPSFAQQTTVVTPDGARLPARLRDAGPGSPGVVFFPMCSPNSQDGWAPVADGLLRSGVSSVIVSHRSMTPNAGGTATGDQRFADADAAVAFLRSRIGPDAPLAVAGSSCGVSIALRTSEAHSTHVRAVVVLSGPHLASQIEFVRKAPGLAVFSGASLQEPPSPDWARELHAASKHPASRVRLLEPRAHGTDLLRVEPTLAVEISEWLVDQLRLINAT